MHAKRCPDVDRMKLSTYSQVRMTGFQVRTRYFSKDLMVTILLPVARPNRSVAAGELQYTAL